MITLIPSKNPSVILSCMSGVVREKCLGGYQDPGDSAIAEGIKESNCVFLMAREDEKDYGFVMFKPEGPGVFSIHLCLKSIGHKTREIFLSAITLARYSGIAIIEAAYPSSNKAVTRLLEEFGFEKYENHSETPVPYEFKRLNLI